MSATVKVLDQFPGADARPPVTITGLTAHATPGTRSNHNHGLNYTPKQAFAFPETPSNDTALTANICEVVVVSVDATKVVVKAAVANAPFKLLIF